MKKRIQKYLAGEREGFSLVELIIVIAIMAILIGVVALAVLPNIQRSRESKDIQALDSIASAANAAVATTQAKGNGVMVIGTVKNGVSKTPSSVSGDTEGQKFANAICESVFNTVAAGAGKVESDSAGKATNIVLSFDVTNKKIEVAYSSDATIGKAVSAEYLEKDGAKQKFMVSNSVSKSA